MYLVPTIILALPGKDNHVPIADSFDQISGE